MLRLLASAGIAEASVPWFTGTDCFNPMFQHSWWSAQDDKGHLLPKPDKLWHLELCPHYNGKPGCCDPSVETDFRRSLDVWRYELQQTVPLLRAQLRELLAVKKTKAYFTAAATEQRLLTDAIEAYSPVLTSTERCSNTVRREFLDTNKLNAPICTYLRQ